MRGRDRGTPRAIGWVALVAAIAVTAGACSSSADTTALSAEEVSANEPVPTTVVRRGPLPTTTTTTTMPRRTLPTAPAVDATLASMISQIAADPALLNGLAGLQNIDLAALFDVDLAAIEQAAIDASGLQDLGALIVGAPQIDLNQLILSQIDPEILARLSEFATQINTASIAAVDGLNQQLIQAIATTVSRIDPATLSGLNTLLTEVDPQGLGQLSVEPSATSVLAVFAASVLESNPAVAQEAHQRFAAEPRLQALLGHLDAIGSLLDPATAAEVVRVGLRVTPEALVSLTRLVSLLNDAEVQDLLGRLNVPPGQFGMPG